MLEEEQKIFERDGVVVIRGMFKDWMDVLEEGVRVNEQDPGQWFRDYTPGQAQGRFWADYCNWQRIEAFQKFVKESPAGDIVKALMQSQSVRMFHEHVLVKGAGSSKVTPWHHDAPYYPVDAKQTLSLWIPRDPVARESSIEFVAGSHKWGKYFRPLNFTGEYYDQRDGKEEMLPDIDNHREEFDIVGWALEPGDAVAFDYSTVHGAPGNKSQQHSRRAVSFRWLGDEAVYVNRGGRTSPPYPQYIDKLSTGDALPEDEFPFIA